MRNNCMPMMLQGNQEARTSFKKLISRSFNDNVSMVDVMNENLDRNMTMNSEDFEEDVHDLLQLCVSAFASSDREHPRKSSVRTVHDLVQISTRHHPNTSSPNYPYINYYS